MNPPETRLDVNHWVLRAMIFIAGPSSLAIQSANLLGAMPGIIRLASPVSRESHSLAVHHDLVLNP